MGHTSRFSMGVDAADYNNDGRPDLIVLDMLPEREEILKTSANAESFNIYDLKVKAGYHPQFARNTLQLNRGGGRFSEIGYLAGVYATDWAGHRCSPIWTTTAIRTSSSRTGFTVGQTISITSTSSVTPSSNERSPCRCRIASPSRTWCCSSTCREFRWRASRSTTTVT